MIRPLNEKDLEQSIKIRRDSLTSYSMSFGADPKKPIDRAKTFEDLKAKNEENFILGFFDNGTLIGTLGFVRYSNPKTRHKAFIWGVFVYPEYWGKKIGSLLLEECISKAERIEGLEKIILGASHISDAAIALYRKFGFEVYGRERKAMIVEGEYIDEILYEKYL